MPLYSGIIHYQSPRLASEPSVTNPTIKFHSTNGNSIRKEMRAKRTAVSAVPAQEQIIIQAGTIYTTSSKSFNSTSVNGSVSGYNAARGAISGGARQASIAMVSANAANYGGGRNDVMAEVMRRYKPGNPWERQLDYWATQDQYWWEYKSGNNWFYTEQGLHDWFDENFKDEEGNSPSLDEWESFWEWFNESQADDSFHHRLPISDGIYALLLMATIYIIKIKLKHNKTR